MGAAKMKAAQARGPYGIDPKEAREHALAFRRAMQTDYFKGLQEEDPEFAKGFERMTLDFEKFARRQSPASTTTIHK
jgi:hypothetical protein